MPRPDRPRLRVRAPLTTLLAAAVLLSLDGTGTLRLGLLAALLHEAGHIFAYRRLFHRWPPVEISPLGCAIPLHGLLPERLELPLAAAGPLANLVLCCAAYGWMAWRGAGWTAYRFAAGNLLVGGANLLPLPGLDGGRILRCLLKGQGRGLQLPAKYATIGPDCKKGRSPYARAFPKTQAGPEPGAKARPLHRRRAWLYL